MQKLILPFVGPVKAPIWAIIGDTQVYHEPVAFFGFLIERSLPKKASDRENSYQMVLNSIVYDLIFDSV